MIDAKILLHTGQLVLGSILGESPRPNWAGGSRSGTPKVWLGQGNNPVIPALSAVNHAWLAGLRV
jgi:hypothetical protein